MGRQVPLSEQQVRLGTLGSPWAVLLVPQLAAWLGWLQTPGQSLRPPEGGCPSGTGVKGLKHREELT